MYADLWQMGPVGFLSGVQIAMENGWNRMDRRQKLIALPIYQGTRMAMETHGFAWRGVCANQADILPWLVISLTQRSTGVAPYRTTICRDCDTLITIEELVSYGAGGRT